MEMLIVTVLEVVGFYIAFLLGKLMTKPAKSKGLYFVVGFIAYMIVMVMLREYIVNNF